MPKKPKTIFIEVTVKQYYGFEEKMINGWSTEKVIEEWFSSYNINAPHATRDGHHYGNTDVVKSVREVTQEELESEATPYLRNLEDVRKRREDERRITPHCNLFDCWHSFAWFRRSYRLGNH